MLLKSNSYGLVYNDDGNAPEIQDKKTVSPERANYVSESFFNAPFQGLDYILFNIPRFLPWAIPMRPFRAFQKSLFLNLGDFQI